jgi:hypothetical protein
MVDAFSFANIDALSSNPGVAGDGLASAIFNFCYASDIYNC